MAVQHGRTDVVLSRYGLRDSRNRGMHDERCARHRFGADRDSRLTVFRFLGVRTAERRSPAAFHFHDIAADSGRFVAGAHTAGDDFDLAVVVLLRRVERAHADQLGRGGGRGWSDVGGVSECRSHGGQNGECGNCDEFEHFFLLGVMTLSIDPGLGSCFEFGLHPSTSRTSAASQMKCSYLNESYL